MSRCVGVVGGLLLVRWGALEGAWSVLVLLRWSALVRGDARWLSQCAGGGQVGAVAVGEGREKEASAVGE